MNQLEHTLAAARAVHADAATRHGTVEGRHTAAVAAHADAVEGRTRLVEEAARGAEIAPKALTNAERAIAAAEETMKLWEDAKTSAAAAVVEALQPVQAAQRAIDEQRFAHACKARIDAAAALEKAGLELGAKHSAWLAAGDELQAAYNLPGGMQMHEIENLRDTRAGCAAVPVAMQGVIVQRGSTVQRSVASMDQIAWGEWAAKARDLPDIPPPPEPSSAALVDDLEAA